MYDHGLGVLEQYGLTARSSSRGRGALICETDQGLKVIREYRGSVKKLELQRQIQQQVEEEGTLRADVLIPNLEGELASQHTDGLIYTVRNWFYGKECDTRSREEICRGAAALARLHKIIHLPAEEDYQKEPLPQECARHNREIRKVQRFLQKKQKKSEFERQLLEAAGLFLGQGLEVTRRLEDSGYGRLRERALAEGCVCHGECNQHNLLTVEGKPAFINFEKWSFDLPVADLYQFMRKILEKHSWDIELGRRMVGAYSRIRPLSREECENLLLRLGYPWKFWKLANYYANNPKVWVSAKTVEKLAQMAEQREKWLFFLENLRI